MYLWIHSLVGEMGFMTIFFRRWIGNVVEIGSVVDISQEWDRHFWVLVRGQTRFCKGLS